MIAIYNHSFIIIFIVCVVRVSVIRSQPQAPFADSWNMPLCTLDTGTVLWYAKRNYQTSFFQTFLNKEDTVIFRLPLHEDYIPVWYSQNTKRMYLTNRDPLKGDEDIYFVEKKQDGMWSKPLALGIQVNTDKNENWAVCTQDEQFIIFSSDKGGGYGGFDLYMSKRRKNGTWGKAYNLGPDINTVHDELFPCLDATDSILFFTRKNKQNGTNNQFRSGFIDRAAHLTYTPIYVHTTRGKGHPYKLLILKNNQTAIQTIKLANSCFFSEKIALDSLNMPDVVKIWISNPFSKLENEQKFSVYIKKKSTDDPFPLWHFRIKNTDFPILFIGNKMGVYTITIDDGYLSKNKIVTPLQSESELWLDWE